ncbi:Inorganic phosphate transporter pho84 [Pichia californica]|uniref:Inorganic phosphate transporter pho84 n=1 Tax=Pichia californica TaxID=460514 RepID=A0A9P6WGM1_9ASCO|nr:Inorganic phosphate transporter pho84 [[Candida] californica]KAG0686820.1 Inorganic phosphate transporter pho84 [[Candida] californica]
MANKTAGGNAAFHNFMNDFADVDDPLERKRLALEAIDNAPFGWYHVRTIMVGGVGFMTDAYDIFSVNLGVSYMSYAFWGGSIPSSTETLIKVSTSVGTVIGQLGFGYLADAVGRKSVYGVELMIMISATILQCTAAHSSAISFPAILTFYRIIMGIGIGADYPLSSIITSEFASTKWRGAIMGAVFANQGWGQFLAGVVAMICVAAYKNPLNVEGAENCGPECIKACDQIWRIIIGIGAVPGMIALYFRLTIPESPRFTMDVEGDLDKATADAAKFASGEHGNATENEITVLKGHETNEIEKEDNLSTQNEINNGPPKASAKDFINHFKQWKHGKILLGTAGSWFMLDVAYYGLGLNTASILSSIGFASSTNVYKSLYNQASGNLILVCAGTIPGYWFTVASVDTIGRKPIQVGGFILLTILFCIIGFGYDKIGSKGRLALYIIAQFFQNFGPNTTTFIVPGECYPTRYRSTAHGMSAASGKVGAIIAQTCIGTLKDRGCAAKGLKSGCWLNHVMEIFALFMLLGIFTSLCIPETKRKTLEQLAEELHGEVDVTKRRTIQNIQDPESSIEMEENRLS